MMGDMRRLKRIAVLAAVAAAIYVVAVSAFLLLFRTGQQPEDGGVAGPGSPPKAAIVDQLSLTAPTPAFVEVATSLLEQAGYMVDYYPGEEVTVDFYRDLPARGYEFLILRVHSSLTGRGVQATDDASLYTTEPYDGSSYLDEQIARRLSIVSYYEGGPEYFGITPEFVRSSMEGKFDDTTIIMMGCDGLKSKVTAEALVQKGAASVISWTGPVSAEHTDAATERLLQYLLIDKLTTQEAVVRAMAEVGPDPSYGSVLRFYP